MSTPRRSLLCLLALGALAATPALAIQPPKVTDFIANLKAEKAWFAALPQVTLDRLQPGDLLLRKHYAEDSPVVQSQRLLAADKGSRFTVHALLYLANGQVGHASHSFGGVVVTPIARIDPLEVLVYRPSDKGQAASAVATMRWLTTQHLAYSTGHCLASAVHSSSFGPVAKGRARQVADHKLPVSDRQMMCSEAASFAFQGKKNAPYVELDAMRVSPLRLEDYVNDHPGKFAFVGTYRNKR